VYVSQLKGCLENMARSLCGPGEMLKPHSSGFSGFRVRGKRLLPQVVLQV
jgi:hypothetical protein